MTEEIDRTFIEGQIREGLDNFIKMATDEELMVVGHFFELQLRKAVFLRCAHNLLRIPAKLITRSGPS